MVTGLEALLFKPLVDAVMSTIAAGKRLRLKRTAGKNLDEAFRLLLLAPNDLTDIEARMALVRAAELLSPKQLLAEELLAKHRRALGDGWGGGSAHGRPGAKGPSIKKAAAKRPMAKKAAAKRAPAKKASAKKAAKRPASKRPAAKKSARR